MVSGTLHFLCGKMGAGKSTYSEKLAVEKNAVLISEDDWLAQLFPNQIKTFDDYREHANRLKPIVFAHVINILKTGTDVVMDFPANTVKQRKWFVEVAEAANATAQLTYIVASDERCLEQIAKRRVEQPARADFDNEAVFREVTRFFQEPEDSEMLQVVRIESSQ